MTIQLAEMLVACLALYALIGGVFGVVFAAFGAARIDPAARSMPVQARFMIFWAAAGLWPFLIVKTILGRRTP